jgi:cytochrome c
MKRRILAIVPLALTLEFLAAGPAFSYLQFSVVEAERTAGRQLFHDHCAACHVAQPGSQGALGPSLVGVVGRQAGSLPGFHYSDGLKKSGIVWTDENLQKFIEDGKSLVPNTVMPHPALHDPVEKLYVIEYLKTLTPADR